MTTQHTPGPWFLVGREIHDRPTEFDETGARIGSTPNSIAEIHSMPFGNEEANAALITSAPDLLAALEALLQNHRLVMMTHGRYTPEQADAMIVAVEARAAIAKARGT